MSETILGPDIPVIHPGDLVASSIEAQRAQFKQALAGGARELALDLAGVQIVDSTGIGLLIQVHNTLAKTGGKLSILHASGNIQGLFKSMRLDSRFNMIG